MLKVGFWIALIGLTAAARPAWAAPRDAKERAAKRACLNGDPVKGVQILTDLYLRTNDPVFLYNQGRCYEQNNRYEEAIGRFREFLRKSSGATDTDKADADSARKHIADCETLLGRKVEEPAQPQPAQQPPPVLAPVVPPPPPPAVQVAAQPSSMAAAPAGAGLRVAGVVTAGVGGAALLAGLVLNLKANSMVSDVQNRYDSGTYSSSKDYKAASQVAYVGGAVCVAGGALLYYLGVRAGRAAVAPVALHDGAGALLTGAF